jgi:hypothetical protein
MQKEQASQLGLDLEGMGFEAPSPINRSVCDHGLRTECFGSLIIAIDGNQPSLQCVHVCVHTWPSAAFTLS